METPAFTVVSVGDLVADIVAPATRFPVEPYAHQTVSTITLEPGGAGNFLIAGARLGMHMVALGLLGDDIFGRGVLDILQQEGVDVAAVVRPPAASTSTVLVLADGEGRHVFLGRYGEAEQVRFTETWRARIRAADAVQTWGYALREDALARAVLESMAYARRHGRPVFFDPGPQVAEAHPDQRRAALAHSDVLLLTEEEVPLVLPGARRWEDARRLLTQGPRLVCVKRGPQGCVLLTAHETVAHPGFRVPVRDTSAAGDSFDAAFVYAYLRGWPLAHMALFANAMGAAKVQKLGTGRQVPTLEEVRRVLAEHGADASLDL